MKNEKALAAAEKFFKTAKEVKCPKCGQVYMTIEKDLTCYICFTNVKLGVVFN